MAPVKSQRDADDDRETPPPMPTKLMKVRSAVKTSFRKAWRLNASSGRGAPCEVSFTEALVTEALV